MLRGIEQLIRPMCKIHFKDCACLAGQLANTLNNSNIKDNDLQRVAASTFSSMTLLFWTKDKSFIWDVSCMSNEMLWTTLNEKVWKMYLISIEFRSSHSLFFDLSMVLDLRSVSSWWIRGWLSTSTCEHGLNHSVLTWSPRRPLSTYLWWPTVSCRI